MWKKKLEQFWNENPVQAIALGALAMTAMAKFIDAVGSARSRNAYAKMAQQSVKRRRY